MPKAVDTIKFWKKRIETAASEHYAVYVAHEQLWKRINAIHEKIMDVHIPKDAIVLDAGCAYGRWSPKFENYVGIDFSPDFIDLAKKKYPDKKFKIASLAKIPYPDKYFDWAIAISMKNMIESNCGEEAWQKMEKELVRTCKKVLLLEYGDEKPGGGINGADEFIIL